MSSSPRDPRDRIGERPPHPATVVLPKLARPGPRVLPPHPATVVLPKLERRMGPHPATVALPRPAWAVQRSSSPVLDLQSIAQQLNNVAKGQEVQILRFNGRHFISTNEMEQSMKLGESSSEVKNKFNAPSASISVARSPDVAAGKKTDLVILYGQQKGTFIHAEQNLLHAFAEWLRAGNTPPPTAWVAGKKTPCRRCYPVLVAFDGALAEIYGTHLVFDDNHGTGQDGGAAEQLRLVSTKGDSQRYQRFVEAYSRRRTPDKVEKKVEKKETKQETKKEKENTGSSTFRHRGPQRGPKKFKPPKTGGSQVSKTSETDDLLSGEQRRDTSTSSHTTVAATSGCALMLVAALGLLVGIASLAYWVVALAPPRAALGHEAPGGSRAAVKRAGAPRPSLRRCGLAPPLTQGLHARDARYSPFKTTL